MIRRIDTMAAHMLRGDFRTNGVVAVDSKEDTKIFDARTAAVLALGEKVIEATKANVPPWGVHYYFDCYAGLSEVWSAAMRADADASIS